MAQVIESGIQLIGYILTFIDSSKLSIFKLFEDNIQQIWEDIVNSLNTQWIINEINLYQVIPIFHIRVINMYI